MNYLSVFTFGVLLASAALAQSEEPEVVQTVDAPASVAAEKVSPASLVKATVVLPADTIIQVTPVDEITSKGMKEGTVRTLQVASDVIQDGTVVIPRGAPIKATVAWRTGKGIMGKSAKFELRFDSVLVNGKLYALKGQHRQEGKGNTVGALLGSALITGRSAVMTSGQIVNAFTAEAIPVT